MSGADMIFSCCCCCCWLPMQTLTVKYCRSLLYYGLYRSLLFTRCCVSLLLFTVTILAVTITSTSVALASYLTTQLISDSLLFSYCPVSLGGAQPRRRHCCTVVFNIRTSQHARMVIDMVGIMHTLLQLHVNITFSDKVTKVISLGWQENYTQPKCMAEILTAVLWPTFGSLYFSRKVCLRC